MDVVKQNIKADDLRALVGSPITAKHLGGLIYELKSGGATLVSYEQTARVVAGDKSVGRWSGTASLAIGITMLLWSVAAKRRALCLPATLQRAVHATVRILPTFQEL